MSTLAQGGTRTATCPGAVACDLARQCWALDADDLHARMADVAADRDVYHELLTHALAGWHDALAERDRLRRRVYDLLDTQPEAA
jgi:hypothetical protein